MVTARADHGGGPQHVYQLIGLAAREIEVYVACPREKPYWDRYEGIVSASRMLEIPHRSFRLGALLAIMRFVREQKVDLIHAHGMGAGLYVRLASMLTGVPCCYTPHGVTPISTLGSFVKAVSDFLLSAVTARIIGVSASEADAIRRRSLWKAGIVVIPNGVQIPGDRVNAGAVLASRPFRVIHVTRFVFQKNPELLVSIMEELKKAGALGDFQFDMLGDGPDRERIHAMMSDAGVAGHAVFHGAVSNVGDFYRAAFCLISTSRWEGLPLALLEVMAVGVPVVATDVVGNRDAVGPNETGYLFGQTDAAEAARCLMELSRSPGKWRALSEGSRQRAENEFSDTRMTETTIAAYRGVLGRESS